LSLSPLPIVTVHASFAVMGFHCLEFGKGSEFKEEREEGSEISILFSVKGLRELLFKVHERAKGFLIPERLNTTCGEEGREGDDCFLDLAADFFTFSSNGS